MLEAKAGQRTNLKSLKRAEKCNKAVSNCFKAPDQATVSSHRQHGKKLKM